MVKVGIVGASGYGGGELLRWIAGHPHARVEVAISDTYAGRPASCTFPGLAKRGDIVFASREASLEACDVVFLARDNGVAMALAPDLVAQGKKVIDLSADYRFRDPAVYDAWYKGPHASPELTRAAVYGLPELHRDAIRRATLVGNPGCYTTAAILALAPLLAHRRIDPATILVDAKTGVSGAGRSKFLLDYHFPELNESACAYKIAGAHRHTPEIEQELSEIAGEPIALSFTPHLVPMTRGILATCYATLPAPVDADTLREEMRRFYADAPFVWVTDALPATKHVLGSNMCHIGLGVDARTRRVTVVSAIDNLGKGQAGAAVQNMNLMCGFDETAGLNAPGLWP